MLIKFMKKILAFFILLISTNSYSAEYESNFNIEKFKLAQNDGKVVVVHSWNKFCNTCSKQKPILKKASTDFKDIIFMNFEQTKDKDIAKLLKIDYWTTIVVYKDNKELVREIGLFKEEDIYNLIKKGI
jgi:thiol-disulfide isomerase/thioredoxin